MRFKLFLGALAALCAIALGAVPALAVTVGPEPTAGIAAGSEARTDELVSPAVKDGAQAGYSEATRLLGGGSVGEDYSVASPSGEAILYPVGSALGTTSTSLEPYAVSRWSPSSQSWTTSAVLPPPFERSSVFEALPASFYPAADLSRAAFTSQNAFAPAPDVAGSPNVYLSVEGGPVNWIGRPQLASPDPALGAFGALGQLVIDGASPSLETIYFQYPGTLLEGDAPGVTNLYESHSGTLRNIGVLPDGTRSEAGAEGAAASTGSLYSRGPQAYANQVSEDGTRIFFETTPEGAKPQFYAHTQGDERSVLVSRDDCIAKEGACTATAATEGAPAPSNPTSFFASPNGEAVFFQDVARLTPSAPETTEPKMYEFNVPAQTLTYVADMAKGEPAGKAAEILGASRDGSRVLYREDAAGTWILGFWERRAGGGEQSRTVASFAAAPVFHSVRATAEGSAFVFTEKKELRPEHPEPASGAPASGLFNNKGVHFEVYRFVPGSNELNCLSCALSGTTPSANASISNDDAELQTNLQEIPQDGRAVDSRGITTNGEEVFFQTAQALLPQDINGVENVYEWKDNHLYPISSGHSQQASYLLDNGENGENVFFATAEGISPEDLEGGYDVYDARIGAPTRAVTEAEGCRARCQQMTAPPGTGSLVSGAVGPAGNLTRPPKRKTERKTARKAVMHGGAKARRHKLRQCRKHARRRKNARKRGRALRRCGEHYGHAASHHGHRHTRKHGRNDHKHGRSGGGRRG